MLAQCNSETDSSRSKLNALEKLFRTGGYLYRMKNSTGQIEKLGIPESIIPSNNDSDITVAYILYTPVITFRNKTIQDHKFSALNSYYFDPCSDFILATRAGNHTFKKSRKYRRTSKKNRKNRKTRSKK